MGLFSYKSYYKPGKGVEKDAPQKNAFFHFFELYGRKFWRFIEVNFIYLLVLLPILLPKHRTSFRFLTAATAAQNSTASVVSFIPPAVEPDAPPISISAIVVISEASLIAE